MSDDEELLRAWRAGDRGAGNTLVDRHFKTVYRFFRSKVDDDAEDLTQKTFLASLEGLDRLRRDRDFRAYLLGIARHVLFRRFRTHKTRARLDDFLAMSVDELVGSPSQVIANRQERQLLLQGLRGIPVDHQICLELHYWENMGVADIAEVLGVAPGTVKSRLHRAREQLRKRIGEIEADPALKESTIDSLDAVAVALRDDVDESRDEEP